MEDDNILHVEYGELIKVEWLLAEYDSNLFITSFQTRHYAQS
jgi:hypothetical protein